MRIVWGLVAMAISLAACQTTQTATAPQPAPSNPTYRVHLTASQKAAVVAGVRRQLIDPYSAVVNESTIAAAREAGAPVMLVCGLVNAKNKFGAYTGDTIFYGALTDSGQFVVLGLGGSDTSRQVDAMFCRTRVIEALSA